MFFSLWCVALFFGFSFLSCLQLYLRTVNFHFHVLCQRHCPLPFSLLLVPLRLLVPFCCQYHCSCWHLFWGTRVVSASVTSGGGFISPRFSVAVSATSVVWGPGLPQLFSRLYLTYMFQYS